MKIKMQTITFVQDPRTHFISVIWLLCHNTIDFVTFYYIKLYWEFYLFLLCYFPEVDYKMN